MSEQYANDYTATLADAGGITSGQTTLTLSTATNAAAAPFRIRIDTELILVRSRSGTACSSCVRGSEGTTAASHTQNATIEQVLTRGGVVNAPGYIDVRSCGATGDGSTDDTAAFVAARDLAGTSGEVHVPAGTFLTGALPLNVNSQRWVIDRGAIVKAKNGLNDDHLVISGTDIIVMGPGTFDGNKANQTTGTAVVITGARARLRGGTTYQGSHDSGMVIADADRVEIDGVVVTTAGGISIFGYGNATNTLVRGCTVIGSSAAGGNHAIAFHSNTSGKAVSGARVVDNLIEVWASAGFGIEIGQFSGDRPQGCLVGRNSIYGKATHEGGISLAEMDYGVVEGNLYDAGGQTVNNCGYELARANDCIMQGNSARRTTVARLGISIDQANRSVIQGNYVYGWKLAAGGAGLMLTTSDVNNDASDNSILGNVLVAQGSNSMPGIWVQANASGREVSRNIISHNVLYGTGSGTAIKLQKDAGTLDATIVVGNSFHSWATKVDLGSATNTVQANGN